MLKLSAKGKDIINAYNLMDSLEFPSLEHLNLDGALHYQESAYARHMPRLRNLFLLPSERDEYYPPIESNTTLPGAAIYSPTLEMFYAHALMPQVPAIIPSTSNLTCLHIELDPSSPEKKDLASLGAMSNLKTLVLKWSSTNLSDEEIWSQLLIPDIKVPSLENSMARDIHMEANLESHFEIVSFSLNDTHT